MNRRRIPWGIRIALSGLMLITQMIVGVGAPEPAQAAACNSFTAVTGRSVYWDEYGRRVWRDTQDRYSHNSGCRDINLMMSFNAWHNRYLCMNYRLFYPGEGIATPWKWVCADGKWIAMDRKQLGRPFFVESHPDPAIVQGRY